MSKTLKSRLALRYALEFNKTMRFARRIQSIFERIVPERSSGKITDKYDHFIVSWMFSWNVQLASE
jgi:hypothetical protein